MANSITPFLWFDNQAEEAANYFITVFKDGEIHSVSRNGEDGPAFMVTFRLGDQEFMALNGGPQFTFNEATSFFINCNNQEEVDHFWERLSEGGEEGQCGWLKDKYGLSWQVVPSALMEMMSDEDPARANAVTQAMMQMSKIDIAGLEAARDAVLTA